VLVRASQKMKVSSNMNISIEIPDYNTNDGLVLKWENGFNVCSKVENSNILISANKEGLISLANHLLNLAQDIVPIGHHIHLDAANSLEEGSVDLIIQKY
jgi:hypothetical protein